MEPESISKLRASFGEYEMLGEQHREVSSRIEALQEAMKMSRQRGAFQALQNQMREIKELVKKKEDLDAKMAVADLARKKDDDHRLAMQQETSYSEQLDSVSGRISQLAEMVVEFSESAEEQFDFTRCQRPDGSFYGTRGKCKKGSQTGAPAAPSAAPGASAKKPNAKSQVKELQGILKEKTAGLAAMKKQMVGAIKAYNAMEKATRKNPTPENRKSLRLAQRALAQKEREISRAEKEADAIGRQWSKARERLERSKMSPAQLASERALDREIRERG